MRLYLQSQMVSRALRFWMVIHSISFAHASNCSACTRACPFKEWMDIGPAEMLQRTVAGAGAQVVQSRGIWLCTDCRACSRACPARIDVGAFVEALRREALASGARADARIAGMHELLTRAAVQEGRLREGRFFLAMRFKHRSPFPRGALALALAVKGKFGRLFSPAPRRTGGDG